MKRVLVCAAATAVWTVSLSQPAEPAQGQPCITDPPPVYHPWLLEEPTPDLPVAILAAICDLFKDLTGDVIWVNQGTAVVSLKPAIYVNVTLAVHAGGTPLENVTGLASSPGVGIGSSEAFYAANGSGLSLWSHLEDPEDPGAFTATPVESTLWINATHLHAADLDGGLGRHDVFGINEDKDKALVVRHNGQGYGSTLQLPSPLGDILDVASVDWFHNSVQHLAVLYEGGLGIISLTTPPSLVQVFPFASDVGVITTVTMPNGYEAVAWARTEPSTSRAALVLKGSGGLSAGPIELNLKDCASGTINVQPFAMEALDYDLLPGEDLLLALPDERIAVMKNQGSTGGYFSTLDGKYDIALVGELYGLPGVGQLDDGPEDIAVPSLDGDLYIFTQLPYAYALDNEPPTSAEILLLESEWGLPDGPGVTEQDRQLNMAFTVPVEYSEADHIEVILWHISNPTPPYSSSYVTLPAVHHRVYALEQEWGEGLKQWIPMVDMAGDTCWPAAQGQDHYFTEYRFVKWNSTTVTQAWRVFSAGFTLRMNCGSAEFGGDDDVFLEYLIDVAQAEEYVYGDGIEILSTSELSDPDIGPPDLGVHGLFHPSAKPPLNPGNLPPPGAITVSPVTAEGFY